MTTEVRMERENTTDARDTGYRLVLEIEEWAALAASESPAPEEGR